MSHAMRAAAIIVFLCAPLAALAGSDQDAHIRAVVSEMLAAKDAQIERLESRVQELERQLAGTPAAPPPPSQPPLSSQVVVAPQPAPEPAASGMAEGLALSAFFSVTGTTEDSDDSTYGFGPVELHLDYELDESFAAALALVWDDGS